MPSPIQSFEGVNNNDNQAVTGSAYLPPDTNGDVGPNHYVQWVNSSFAIWNKSSTLLYGPAAGNTLWSGFGGACQTQNDGDPIVLYDPLADRWLMSQFAHPNSPSGPFYQCIAVSQTPDPTGAWYRYAFLVHNTKFNDYPKFGVWPDGYYMSVNQFTSSGAWAGAGAYAFDRANMLAGNPATFQYFDLNSVNPNFGGMLPSDLDGARPPPAGSPNYFVEVDDSTWIAPNDALRIWEFHVDWTNTANSTFGVSRQPNAVLSTDAFDPNMCSYAVNCIPQPGTTRKLDAISDRLMYRLQYRNFGTHESLVVNHTVDVDGTDHAGIRWYEVRDPGGSPYIYQQGTYAPDANHRWMGSMAMDGNGNMALGYSVSSSTIYPSIRYTGRLASDTLGTMPQAEETLIAGGGSQTHSSSRWGDYSMMAVDPVDDCTFWYTQEYYQTTSSASWRTRIGSFKFPSCTNSPVLSTSAKGVSSVTASPGGTITYTLTLTNTGSLNATARVTDTLPLSVTYVSGSATAGATYVTASRAVTWTGVVTAGSALSLTYSAAITSPLDNGTAITNTATIYDGVNAPFETAPVTTTVSSSPNLSTSAKAVSSPNASPRATITYTVTLTNTGNMNATGRLTDTLPITVTYVSGSATGGATYATATNSITWTGVVTAGSALSLTYSAAITSPLDNGTAITNTATINDGVNAPFDTVPVTTTIVSSPNLSSSGKMVDKTTANPGQVLTYTVTLSNTGSMNAYSARLTDTLPITVTYVSGSATAGAIYATATRRITWTGVVTAGSALSLTYSAAITSPLDNGTAITNTATINDGVNAPFDTAPVTTTIVSSPNLSSSGKMVDKTTANPGQVLTYTVTLSNTGNMNASARLTDTLPTSLTYVAGSATGGATYDTGSRSLTWTGVVTAGSALSLTYSAAITSPLDNGTAITNTATIYDEVNAPFETAPVTTTIVSSPNLSSSVKMVDKTTANPGQVLTYTVTLSNTGNMNASTARLTDTLPLSLTYVSGSATAGAIYATATRSITWTGVVTAGRALSLTYSAVITSPLSTVATITNVATIYDGVNPAFETVPVTTTVTPTIWRLYLPYLAKNHAAGW